MQRMQQRPQIAYLVLLMILILQLRAPTPALSQALPDAKVSPVPAKDAAAAEVPPDLSNKRVLLLHAYSYEAASYVVMDPIFLKGFMDAGLDGNNLHFEFMDLLKHPDPAYRREFVEYLRRKLEKLPIDLIIAGHSTALSFLVEEGKDLFPGVPVINVIATSDFLSNEDFRTAYERRMRSLKRPFVILPFTFGADLTVKSILSLRPDTRFLVVISGRDRLDKVLEQSVRRSLGAWEGRLQIEYFSGLALEDVLERVASLAPKTAILHTIFSADAQRTYRNPDVAQRISKAANAPVFGLYDTLLGKGIVGGLMTHHGNEAERTVQLGLEILRGRLPIEPVIINPAPLIPIFDWEQLNRWGMDENSLPPGSTVLNRPKTLWSEYKGFIIGGIAVFLAQTLLAIGLLVQRNLRNKAQFSLHQKTEELDQFFNVNMDLFCIANTGGYFEHLNPAWEKVFGYTRDELLAKRFLEFVHPDDVEQTKEALSSLAGQERLPNFVNRYRCRDGTYRWLEWTSAPVGNLVYAAARDITERKRMEQELEERRRFETLLADISRQLVLLPSDRVETEIENAQRRICELLDLDRSTLWQADEGKPRTMLLTHFHQIPGSRPPAERMDAMDLSPWTTQKVLDGETVTISTMTDLPPEADRDRENFRTYGTKSTVLVPLSVGGGPVFGLLAFAVIRAERSWPETTVQGFKLIAQVFANAIARKRTEAEVALTRSELLHIERSMRLNELTASLAHELNQPLTAILSNAQAALRFLKADKPDLNEFQEILRDIISDDQRAGNVIRSLRSMMKREVGEKKPILLNNIVNDVFEIFRSEAVFRNVRMETELEGSSPLVFGDKTQLQQVILNIVMNAVEAMSQNQPERRKLILRTQRKGQSIWMTARDFGPGIDQENLERVFQPFYTTKGTGLGMGLAVCSSIIKDHRGRIWAQNNPDGGATFFIELPICESGEGRPTERSGVGPLGFDGKT